jgi:hypothetical protein
VQKFQKKLSAKGLKTIRNLLYSNQNVLSNMVIKTNQLMLYKVKATVCSEIRTKHSKQSHHLVKLPNVNLLAPEFGIYILAHPVC